HLGRDSTTGVIDRDGHFAPPGCAVVGMRLDRELAALGHSVEGVRDHLHQRLLQLHRVYPYRGQIRRNAHPKLDTALSNRRREGRKHLVDEMSYALRHGMERRRPAETEKVADSTVQTIYLPDDGVEVLLRRGGVRMPADQL